MAEGIQNLIAAVGVSNAKPRIRSQRKSVAGTQPSVPGVSVATSKNPNSETSSTLMNRYSNIICELLSYHEQMVLRFRHEQGLGVPAIALRMHLPETIIRDLLASAEQTIQVARRALVSAMLDASGQLQAAS